MGKFTAYEVFRVHDLSGGMAPSISPRKIDQTKGFSNMFKNFDPSLLGIPKKRPACIPIDEKLSVESPPTGVHYFNRQSVGDEYLMLSYGDKVAAYAYPKKLHAGVEGADEGGFGILVEYPVLVEIDSGLAEGVPVYFLTIADQVIFTNGVDTLRSWNGDGPVKKDLGARKATMRTYLLYANNDLKFTARESGKVYIKVQYSKAKNKTSNTTVTVSGNGTEESPHLILVHLAWDDNGITSTARQVKAAIEAHADANALVEVEHVSESDGSMQVTEMPEQMLTGGYDPVKGKYLINYRSRAVLADGSKLMLSHTGDPHLWAPEATGSNAVEVYVSPDDGEEISGLLNMGDGGVLIGKPNTLYGLFGYKRDNFVIDELDPNVGVSSHETMVYLRPYAYWVWNTGIYRSQPGGVPERISFPIQELLDEQVDVGRIKEAAALAYKRMYIVSLPKVGGGFVTYCYHVDQESWGLWTAPEGLAGHTQKGSETIMILRGSTTVMKLAEGVFTDLPDGNPIDTEITTVPLDLGVMEQDKDIGDLYVLFRGTGETFIVDVDVFVDSNPAPVSSARQVELSGPPGSQVLLRVPVGKVARFIQVSIRDSREQQLVPLAISYTYQLRDVV